MDIIDSVFWDTLVLRRAQIHDWAGQYNDTKVPQGIIQYHVVKS